MKRFIALIIFVTVLMPALVSAGAASGTVSDTTNNPAVVRLPADENGRTRVLAYSLTSDAADHYATIYLKSGNTKTTVDGASSSTTINVTDTTGFASGDIIIVQSADGSVIDHYSVTGVTGTTSGTLTVNTAISANLGNVGDRVYKVTVQARVPVGAATVTAQSQGGVIIGPKDSPVMILLGGSSPAINYLTYSIR